MRSLSGPPRHWSSGTSTVETGLGSTESGSRRSFFAPATRSASEGSALSLRSLPPRAPCSHPTRAPDRGTGPFPHARGFPRPSPGTHPHGVDPRECAKGCTAPSVALPDQYAVGHSNGAGGHLRAALGADIRGVARSYLDTIRVLANAIEARDHYTAGHTWRVTRIAFGYGPRDGMELQEAPAGGDGGHPP